MPRNIPIWDIYIIDALYLQVDTHEQTYLYTSADR